MTALTKNYNTIPFLVLMVFLGFNFQGASAQKLRLEMQALHSDSISFISKSSDGRYTVTSGFDGFTKVWNEAGNVLLSVEGHQSTLGTFSLPENGYNSQGCATNGRELVVAEQNSGLVKCFDLGSKKITRLFTADSIRNYKAAQWIAMGYNKDEALKKLDNVIIETKAYFARVEDRDLLVVERLLVNMQEYRSYQDISRRQSAVVTTVELWNLRSNKMLGTFLGSSSVVSKGGNWFAVNGVRHFGNEKEGINVYKIKGDKIEHHRTISMRHATLLDITGTDLFLVEGLPMGISGSVSRMHVISLLTGTLKTIADTISVAPTVKDLSIENRSKWNKESRSNLQIPARAQFLKNAKEILITGTKATTVIDATSGKVTELYSHPKDTSRIDLFVPIKTADSISYHVTLQGIMPLVTHDRRLAVFPPYSQPNYSGLIDVLDLKSGRVLEFPYGPDSLYAFQFSPDRLWRVEMREMNSLILERMKMRGYQRKNPMVISLFRGSKLIFQTDTYCDVTFSTDSKWINFKNPETKMSNFFPLVEVQSQSDFLPLMTVVKLPKKSKRDTTVSFFEGNIYTDTITLRFLYNSLVFSQSNSIYAASGYYPDDFFFLFTHDLSETLIKNKARWDRLAKDTVGLAFESSWLSCRWMIAEPQEIKSFSLFFFNTLEENRANWFKMSPNGRYLLTVTETKEEEFIHSTTRDGYLGGDKINLTLKLHDSWSKSSTTINKTDKELPAYKTKFSEDGSLMYYINEDKLVVLNTANQSMYHTFAVDAEIQSADISGDNSKVLVTTKSDVSIWDLKSKLKMLSFQLTEDGSLVATHPTGLFDTSEKMLNNLHFIQNGIDVISISQLKERYYEPGLWKKVMSGEKLRDVASMKSIELPPDIRVGQVDAKGYLPIELANKGGGIGEVTILINGKEAIVDARPKGFDSKAKELSLKVFIGNHKALVKGADNFLAVKAWNEGHWVVSRGAIVTYSTEGNDGAYKPVIHIVTSGVSDYSGTELDLKYAAKDAEDVSKALQLGAKKLFGADKSIVYSLTTSGSADQYPTKTNILKAFEKVTTVAHPLDIVVVYLSGHGINYGGLDGDWYYLTQDAHTSNSAAYGDPEIRRTSTLSSNELVELFKNIPALKQVLIIDACASGKVVENLMAKKDIESTTLRALDRMRDRTGLHIITGCTADAVSYEASKYGQGVLTYSLLEGIRGAALREDQFIDINKLFQYAHDRVPSLAVGIGGIQTPQIFSPQGAQSFDIGFLTEQEKKDIPIAKIRPVYIRSSFLDDDQLDDVLELGKKVDDALNEAAGRGTAASLIFVDVRDYPEGCKLSGKYRQTKGIIKLKLRKKCEGKDETIEITGRTVDEVKNKILSHL